MNQLIIRNALLSDIDALVKVGMARERVQRRLNVAAAGEESFLVAEADAEVIGMLSIRWSGGCDGVRPWFYGAEVRPDWRRRGVGTAMWAEGEALALGRGLSEAALDVEVSNEDARRLYERLGYVVIGPHLHQWQAIDPDTEQVTATGTSETWAMRKQLVQIT